MKKKKKINKSQLSVSATVLFLNAQLISPHNPKNLPTLDKIK